MPFNNLPGALSADIKLLGSLLGTVIREQHGDAAFETVERVRAAAKARRQDDPGAHDSLLAIIDGLTLEQKRILIKAFSNYFQLINIAEDQQRVRVLRQRENDDALVESIDAAIATLQANGTTAVEIRALLRQVCVRLVITAHPTEAKRREVLVKLRQIATLMDLRDRTTLLPREEHALVEDLLEEIEELWQTRPTRTVRASVMDEVEFGLYFITSVVMDVLVDIMIDLHASLEKYYPGEDWWGIPPLLRYASWIGGDRDGHPDVTPEVTLETLAHLRDAARRAYLSEVAYLREHFTQSAIEVPISDDLRAAVIQARPDPRFHDEVYREWLDIIWERLDQDAYRAGDDLLADLHLMEDSLCLHRGERVAEGALERLMLKVRLFGLHLLPLEVRQDARLHRAALDEIFRTYNICTDYADGSETTRIERLVEELANPRPLFPPHPDFSDTTNMIIATWRMIAQVHRQYGPGAIDVSIASMSTAPSDVLAMLLFAQEVGVARQLDLVPLFETINDLNAAPEVLDTLFNLPAYQEQLAARGSYQQIMIGYSDSSKDGGYLASNWGLYTAQQRIAAVCHRHRVTPELFHGRGGSIGRGGGPTNRAILAQPRAAMQGRVKITEQGEVIAYRYSNAEIARRHLNQVLHAVLMATGAPVITDVQPEWRAAMETLAQAGRNAYRAFVYDLPGFLDYWQQATPIRELALMPIGSRPAKRGAGGFSQVRAIPWVFSWMQSRAIIPSWYGVGHALQTYCAPDGASDQARIDILRTMYADWPFFRAITDNLQLDLAKADMGIAALYASLVEDDALRDTIFSEIRADHARATHWLCTYTGQQALLDHTPVIQRSIERRNPYVDPLNFIQVGLLRQLRHADAERDPQYDAILRAVMMTVNGIAAGMKTTG